MSALLLTAQGWGDVDPAASAEFGSGTEIRGLEDLRREASDEQARGSERSADPTESPGAGERGDSEQAEQQDDGDVDGEPEPPEGTVVPPSPRPDGGDDAGGEDDQGKPESEGTLPGGFPPVSGCDAAVPPDGSVANGWLGSEHLCDVGDGFLLRPDAAAAFVAMAGGYADATGESLVSCIGNSYRTYDEQVDLYARKPSLAAAPGTSEHGWGLAIDFECGANSYTSPFHAWLDANGGEYGWINPPWAQPGGSRPEPWHWEFDPSLL